MMWRTVHAIGATTGKSAIGPEYESLDARKAFVAKPAKIWQGRPQHRACEDWHDVADEPLFVTH